MLRAAERVVGGNVTLNVSGIGSVYRPGLGIRAATLRAVADEAALAGIPGTAATVTDLAAGTRILHAGAVSGGKALGGLEAGGVVQRRRRTGRRLTGGSADLIRIVGRNHG